MSSYNALLTNLHRRAAQRPRRILLPESADPRVLEAARQLQRQQLCTPVFLVPNSDCADITSFDNDPDRQHWFERASEHLHAVLKRKTPEATSDDARTRLAEQPLLLAAALVAVGYADGGIAGSIATTADVLRAGLRGIGLRADATLVSSIFLMALNDRVVSFGDCAVNPEPDFEALAQIAIDSAMTHQQLTGTTPRTALLAFSTLGSAQHATIDMVRDAVHRVRARAPELAVDGELQFDTAFDAGIATRKAPQSDVAGQANVYIFPNLHAANIGYKIAERVGGARAIGPILQGLAKPWQDLSRGCSAQDIADLAVITAILAD